jgi:hypothetical protein
MSCRLLLGRYLGVKIPDSQNRGTPNRLHYTQRCVKPTPASTHRFKQAVDPESCQPQARVNDTPPVLKQEDNNPEHMAAAIHSTYNLEAATLWGAAGYDLLPCRNSYASANPQMRYVPVWRGNWERGGWHPAARFWASRLPRGRFISCRLVFMYVMWNSPTSRLSCFFRDIFFSDVGL